MRLKVIICRQNSCSQQLLLQCLNEIQEILWLAAADVVHGVRRHGKAVLTGAFLRSLLHHTDDALDNVIHICEVPAAIAVVVNLDGLPLEELVGEAEVGHVGATGGAVDGEEPQAGGGDVIQLAVAVGEELVALLGGGVKRHRVIHTVVGAEGDFLVAAVDGAGGGVDQVFNRVVPTGFEDVVEANHVTLDVCIRILN